VALPVALPPQEKRDLPHVFVLAFLPDPSTFEGGVAVAVAAGLVLALILGAVGWFRHRKPRSSPLDSSPPADAGQEYVADLVTGIGQAVMGVREAIELFGKGVLLEDPETGELEENSREVLVEAYRRVDRDYIRQPGWGEDWSYTELEAAKASLKKARGHEQGFLKKARA
jgi:hypothetical protein